MKLKPAAALLGLGVFAVALSGCVFQAPPKAKQIGHKPKVKVAFTLCEPDTEAPTNCPRVGNDAGDFPDASDGRLLVGLRVPKGTKAPRRFVQKAGDFLTIPRRFVRHGKYSRELNQSAPKRRSDKWIGYVSGETNPWKGDDALGLKGKYVVKLGAPRSIRRALKNGNAKRFKLSVTTGGTAVDPAGIECGPNPFEGHGPEGEPEDTVCINDPTRKRLRKSINVRMRP